MELYVYVELCEGLFEDLLLQFQTPSLFKDLTSLEGLLLVAESLLSYLLQIEALTPTQSTSALLSVQTAINCTGEIAQLLNCLIEDCFKDKRRGRGRPRLGITEGQLEELL